MKWQASLSVDEYEAKVKRFNSLRDALRQAVTAGEALDLAALCEVVLDLADAASGQFDAKRS